MFTTLTVLVLAGMLGPLLGYGRRGLGPVVVGELLGGVVLGRTGFGVIDSTMQPLPVFSALGFAMLMFTAGTHVDIGSPLIRKGFARGAMAWVVTAALSAPLGLLIGGALGVSHPLLIAVLIAGSSAAIAYPIIDEHGLQGPDVALLVAAVAVADSVTVVLMPLTIAASNSLVSTLLGDAAIIAAAAAALLVAQRVRGAHVQRNLTEESRRRGWAYQVRLALLLVLGLSAIAERTGASTLIAGFAAGMVAVRMREPGRVALQLTGIANGFFVPIFFVLLGAELNLRALLDDPSKLVLALLMVIAAVLAHVVGALVAAHDRDSVATGLAASAQLGLPAAAASLGLATGTLQPATAAALVLGGCLTLVPATIGSLMLARSGVASPPAPSGAERDHPGAGQGDT
jgi:Kef-type K+ transport system membrane component KefB